MSLLLPLINPHKVSDNSISQLLQRNGCHENKEVCCNSSKETQFLCVLRNCATDYVNCSAIHAASHYIQLNQY